MSGPPPVESVHPMTVDGLALEGELALTADGDREPRAVAVVCHPHPLYGGSMHNNVVGRLFLDLPGRGVPTLRFNFRGAGGSAGSHDGGDAERSDVVAAIDVAAERYPGRPLLLGGYSFGADVALAVGDDRIGGWLAVSPPLRIVAPEAMVAATDARPTMIVSGSADDFRTAADAGALTASWPATDVRTADGVDHFWMRGLDQVTAAADDLLDRIAPT
ncbi:MAG: alpha/beta hydrolase [Actinomycetota bacterium]